MDAICCKGVIVKPKVVMKNMGDLALFLLIGFIFIFSLFAIYWLLLKLTNHSPSYDQILLTVLSINAALTICLVGIVFKISNDLVKTRSDIRHIERRADLEFKYINKRLDTLTVEFKELKNYAYQKL